MKFGLALFMTDHGAAPDEVARHAEERGFESLFVSEHTHIPAAQKSHFSPEGGPLPWWFSRTLDPFVSLAAAAVATERLRLGTGVCLIAERDPLTTAKAVSSLDYLSQGRVLLGVGAGWNHEEMLNHGTDPKKRFSILHERVEAMKRIWTEDEATYEGRHVAFERIWSWPKPVQQPHPPVLLGGNGKTVVDRALKLGAEWMPEHEAGLVDRIAYFRQRALELGFHEPPPVTVYGVEAQDVDDYAHAQVARCVFWLPAGGHDTVMQRMNDLAAAHL